MAKNSLQLSYRNRKIAGVCGGLGEYFGLDPVIVRIAFVIFLLTGGAGILLYFICWMIMPERATTAVRMFLRVHGLISQKVAQLV